MIPEEVLSIVTDLQVDDLLRRLLEEIKIDL